MKFITEHWVGLIIFTPLVIWLVWTIVKKVRFSRRLSIRKFKIRVSLREILLNYVLPIVIVVTLAWVITSISGDIKDTRVSKNNKDANESLLERERSQKESLEQEKLGFDMRFKDTLIVINPGDEAIYIHTGGVAFQSYTKSGMYDVAANKPFGWKTSTKTNQIFLGKPGDITGVWIRPNPTYDGTAEFRIVKL
ncbi:hypothetical protein KC842_02265 [Candidatus Nomurabacteria bacterium]|nr:hypothetical protein [Candidatus Nomurabacteria bacterium]